MGIAKRPAFYTTKQAADILGVSAPTVIKWVEEGRLRAHRTPGGHRRISVDALRAFEAEVDKGSAGEPTRVDPFDSGFRVLVVDPEPDYSDLISEYFRLQGDVTVIQSLDPLTVGYHVGAFRPHVLVFDVSCPRLHIREIVSLTKRLKSMRVVVLSSSWSGELQGITTEDQRILVAQKPIKLDQLWRLVAANSTLDML